MEPNCYPDVKTTCRLTFGNFSLWNVIALVFSLNGGGTLFRVNWEVGENINCVRGGRFLL